MPTLSSFLAFGLVSLGMAMTPGPNMIYLMSRSVCQGRQAGFISLIGVALGFLVYLACATLGITAFMMAVPFAYDVLRLCGAAYLLYLAWQAVRPGHRSPFAVRALPGDSSRKLFVMGFVTSLTNPKIAVMYLSLLPQFIVPGQGSVLAQSLALGCVQILVSVSVNALVICGAGAVAVFFGRRPRWASIQRWVMGTVLAGLAVRIALEPRR